MFEQTRKNTSNKIHARKYGNYSIDSSSNKALGPDLAPNVSATQIGNS